MPRKVGQASYNTFVKGLITEAGPLAFPENSTTEDMNCVLTMKGSHRRRYGVREEANGTAMDFTTTVDTLRQYNLSTYTWKAPDNEGSKSFLVIQKEEDLLFYDISDRGPIAFNATKLEVNFSNYIVDKEVFKKGGCSFASGKGYLFVCGKGLNPFYVKYDKTDSSLKIEPLELKIRDTEGVKEILDTTEQPSTLSKEHLYNLINQGWLYPTQTTAFSGRVFCILQVWQFGTKTNGAQFSINGTPIGTWSAVYAGGGVSAQGLADLFNDIPEEERSYLRADPISATQLRIVSDDEHSQANINKTVSVYMQYRTGDKLRAVSAVGTLVLAEDTASIITKTPYTDYKEATGRYPSNVQQWFVGRAVEQKINTTEVANYPFGSQRAPRGFCIIDPFTKERSLYVKDLEQKQKDTSRVIDIAFLGGRIFYLRDSEVLYSQVLTDINNASKCYQEGDPTAEDSFDLVDTDGGVIPINDMAHAIAFFELPNGLLIFASNGVWIVSGLSSDEGFKATSYSVRRLSSIDCISKKSLVNVGGIPLFWSRSGIYTVQSKELSGYDVQSLSGDTIQALYKDIALYNLENSKGIYDEGSQKVIWLYDDVETPDGITPFTRSTKGLIFDVRLKAFYELELPKDDAYPYICGFFNTPWLTTVNLEEELLDNSGEIVLDNNQEIVYTERAIGNTGLTNVKYLAYTIENNLVKYTICDFSDTSFTDWSLNNRQGLNYESYFTTGYNTAGDSTSTKDVVYMITQLSRTEDAYSEDHIENQSSCMMQMRWDFENMSYSNKWTEPRQIYRAPRLFAPTLHDENVDYRGLPVVTTKHKVRGSGRALQIKFISEPGKNFEVLGWSLVLGMRG